MDKIDKVILISYVPLMLGEAGVTFDNSLVGKELAEFLDHLPSGEIHACIWMMKDDKPFPIFVIQDMDDIVDHMLIWSEDKPVNWFELKIASNAEKYAIALAPSLPKSIERWRLAYQLRVGYPPPKNVEYKVLFRPLNFTSGGGSSAYFQIKDKIGKELRIGFIDLKNVDRNNPNNIKDEDVRTLGPFPVNTGVDFSYFMTSVLDNAKDPNNS